MWDQNYTQLQACMFRTCFLGIRIVSEPCIMLWRMQVALTCFVGCQLPPMVVRWMIAVEEIADYWKRLLLSSWVIGARSAIQWKDRRSISSLLLFLSIDKILCVLQKAWRIVWWLMVDVRDGWCLWFVSKWVVFEESKKSQSAMHTYSGVWFSQHGQPNLSTRHDWGKKCESIRHGKILDQYPVLSSTWYLVVAWVPGSSYLVEPTWQF